MSITSARTLTAEGIPAEAPYNGAVYELTGGAVALLRQGTMVPMAKVVLQLADKPRTSPAFERLLNMGKRLLVMIEHNRGGANKDLPALPARSPACAISGTGRQVGVRSWGVWL